MAPPILLLEILLVAAGIIFLVLEFKAPGHIVSGVIAILCFGGFFLIHFLVGSGALIVVGLVLFLIGLALLGIELFFTGDGIAGVCGILLILGGLVFAGMEGWPDTVDEWSNMLKIMLRHVLTMACAVLIALQLAKYLPDVPYLNRLLLVPPADKPEEESPSPSEQEAEALLGQTGIAISMLKPSGTAQFGDRRVDVSTEWDFIEPGTPVQVVSVEGTRIVVKRAAPR